MYWDVGMAVPKPQKLGAETGHKVSAQIIPSLYTSLLYMTFFFDYALRLLGNNIVYEKKCRDGVICAVILYPVSTPRFCGFWYCACHPYIPMHF